MRFLYPFKLNLRNDYTKPHPLKVNTWFFKVFYILKQNPPKNEN